MRAIRKALGIVLALIFMFSIVQLPYMNVYADGYGGSSSHGGGGGTYVVPQLEPSPQSPQPVDDVVAKITNSITTVTKSTYQTVISVNVGDYIQFGHYYGDPILWRVINKNDDGSVMLWSDKILSLKPFDANGDMTDGRDDANGNRVNYGSNYWEKSNLREWLNSSDAVVSYSCYKPDSQHVWCGYNTYDMEAGFLHNFTENEQNCIQPVIHKVILSNADCSVKDGGNSSLAYIMVSQQVPNYDDAYYKQVEDKVFLLDVKELNDYVHARGYMITKFLTDSSIENSEYKNSSLTINSPWHYWLRTPYASDSSSMCYVNRDNWIGYYSAYNSGYNGVLGVAPALNLKCESIISGGNGETITPYIIDGQTTGEKISVQLFTTATTDSNDIATNVSIHNNLSTKEAGTIVVGMYNLNGKQIDVRTEQLEISGNAIVQSTVYFNKPQGCSVYYFKVFNWDGFGSMIPSSHMMDYGTQSHSMKGFEVYCWKQGDNVYFNVLYGTNRSKLESEIYDLNNAVCGLDAIKRSLDRIADGEFIQLILKGVTTSEVSDLSRYTTSRNFKGGIVSR